MPHTVLVDVFCAPGAAGNAAGVVPDAAGLDAATMQAIAAEVGLSETAFVTAADGRLSLRWFTPACEVDLCGHATLAAAAALEAAAPIAFTYAGGTLTVRPETLGGETIYWLSRPAPEVRAFRGQATELLAALGNPPLDDELPLAVTAEMDLLLPLRDAAVVDRLQPDFDRLADVCRAEGLRGITPLALPGPSIHELRVRFFAPRLGVPEDPATGSVHGAIAVYLHQMEILEHFPEELRALSWQGHPSGPCGQLWLRLLLDPDRNQPVTAEVGGLTRIRP